MIYKIHLLTTGRKGEERECRPRVPTRSALLKLATLLRFLEYVSERCDLFLRGKLVVLRGTSSAVGYLAMGSSVSRVDSNESSLCDFVLFGK